MEDRKMREDWYFYHLLLGGQILDFTNYPALGVLIKEA